MKRVPTARVAAIASAFLVLSFFTAFSVAKTDKAGLKDKAGPKDDIVKHTAVLWRDPGDIAARNLFYGPGGKAHEPQPQGTFTFEKEDMNGTNPKFDVVDQDGVRWKVKLGPEAKPETVASRFVWVAGYFANEEYFMPVLHVQKMQRLHRGRNLVSADGTVRNARLKRHVKDGKKLGTWSWSKNPFTGKPEWYRLRVLMAVMNNWDLKDSNNAIYLTGGSPPEEQYTVSDLGASFGTTGLNWMLKGDPTAYCNSKWINKPSAEFIDFNVPSAPAVGCYIDFPELALRLRLRWLGHHIPRADAHWVGDRLGQLSPNQIRDAFRAGGYSSEDVERLSRTLEGRIGELRKL